MQPAVDYSPYERLPPRFIVHIAKEPISLDHSPARGAHNDPNNQRSLADALRLCQQLHADGVGFSVPEDHVVIDFDHVIDGDQLADWALAVLSKIPPTLVEYSPSGRGLHAFLRLMPSARPIIMAAEKAVAIGNGAVEFLRHGFYSTITGHLHPKYPTFIAEMDGIQSRNLINRIQQLRSNTDSQLNFDQSIATLTEDDIVDYRAQIRSGAQFNLPTFKIAWWSAWFCKPRDETEQELIELYDECQLKNERWRARRKALSSLVSRCYRKADDLHAATDRRRIEQYTLTEASCAEYCGKMLQDALVRTDEAGWLHYHDGYFEFINEYRAQHQLSLTYLKWLADLYASCNDPKLQTQIHKLNLQARTHRTQASIEKLARGTLHHSYKEFDNDDGIINARNCVVDLRTGLTMAHSPTFHHAYMVGVDYMPHLTETPIFDQFLRDLLQNNEPLIEYLLLTLGYSITGETSEHKFFVLYGPGGNGKTTLTNLLRLIMNGSDPAKKYLATMRPDVLVVNRNNTEGIGNDLAAMARARLALTAEVGDRKINDERLKSLTGEDTLSVRFLFREFFDITPRFKLWIQTNQRPRVRGDDEGVWRRAVMFPFLADFRANPDLFILQRLATEKEAIFAKLVRYATQWYRNGLGELPEIVTQQTNEWRSEVDAIARYLDECVVTAPGDAISSGELWANYTEWCEINHERTGPSNQFYQRLGTRGYKQIKINKRIDGKRIEMRGYGDITLINKQNGVDF